MATTTNFGWETPDDTDLVKDGAAAIRTLGGAIDTSLVDLKGGTTGQVLSKASNTDMDFSWVAADDTNAIQNTIVDAKGDIITATAADTPARLAVGANGYTLVADSSTSTGLAYSPTFFAAKNKILNSDYSIWQRGTSFTTVGSGSYCADRWLYGRDGSVSSLSVTREAFTAGSAPVAGYESQYYLRYVSSGWTASPVWISQRIEDVRTFANQTITLSFWAKAGAGITYTPLMIQDFGSGGSPGVATNANSSVTLTTSWARYSVTFTVPSVSGKTIGTSSFLAVYPIIAAANFTIDIWGVQVEAGSTATQFQTATGTIQGELAACQRYLPVALTTVYDPVYGFASSTTATYVNVQFKVPARVAPTGISVSSASHFQVLNKSLTAGTPTGITFDTAGVNSASIYATTTAGSPTIAAGEGGLLRSVNASGLILFTGCEL